MYKVKMQSKSSSELFSDKEGYPSDWMTYDDPPPEAIVATKDEAQQLAALVVRRGYAQPQIVRRIWYRFVREDGTSTYAEAYVT